MEIKVTVSHKRKCFGSIDNYTSSGDRKIWVASFGDKATPNTDVEIEFTKTQLLKFRKMLNDMYTKGKFATEHRGTC